MIDGYDVNLIRMALFLVLLFVVWRLRRAFHLDRLRDDMFSVRDHLFDLAADPHSALSFDSAEYRRVRSLINGTIRFAHRLSLRYFAINSLSLRFRNLRYDGKKFQQDLHHLPARIADRDTSERLAKVIREYEVSLVMGLLRSSSYFKLMFLLFILRHPKGHDRPRRDRFRTEGVIADVELNSNRLARA